MARKKQIPKGAPQYQYAKEKRYNVRDIVYHPVNTCKPFCTWKMYMDVSAYRDFVESTMRAPQYQYATEYRYHGLWFVCHHVHLLLISKVYQ